MLIDQSLANLRTQQQQLALLQERLSTGKQINRPSDDPVGTRRAMATRTSITNIDQFLSNVREAQSFSRISEDAVQGVIDNVRRVRELTLQGANGTLAQEQRDGLALQINQLLEAVIDLANTQSGRRFVFAGTRTQTKPFDPTIVGGEVTAVTYQGNSDTFDVAVSEGLTLTVNQTGDSVFQDLQDTFQTLIDIRSDLRISDIDSLSNVRLGELDDIETQLLNSLGVYGANSNRLSLVEERLRDDGLNFRDLLSVTEDADFAETIMEYNAQEVAFQAALQAGMRLIEPSLLDFLR